MGFVRGNNDLKSIELYGNELPWVNEIKQAPWYCDFKRSGRNGERYHAEESYIYQ